MGSDVGAIVFRGSHRGAKLLRRELQCVERVVGEAAPHPPSALSVTRPAEVVHGPRREPATHRQPPSSFRSARLGIARRPARWRIIDRSEIAVAGGLRDRPLAWMDPRPGTGSPSITFLTPAVSPGMSRTVVNPRSNVSLGECACDQVGLGRQHHVEERVRQPEEMHMGVAHPGHQHPVDTIDDDGIRILRHHR